MGVLATNMALMSLFRVKLDCVAEQYGDFSCRYSDLPGVLLSCQVSMLCFSGVSFCYYFKVLEFMDDVFVH